ncbi:hypothetical protein U1Q18_004675 [Sarracenia purpurea var. burkii]
MEAFSLLKFWRFATSDDSAEGGGNVTITSSSSSTSTTTTTTTDRGHIRRVETDDETDDEDSFFDLEFIVPGVDEKKLNDSRNSDVNTSDSDEDPYNNDLANKDGETVSNFVESPDDVFFRGRAMPSESNSKPQSPISFLRSPPKFRVFMLMLFKKPKSEKTEITAVSPATDSKYQLQSRRFTEKCEVEEVPIWSLLTRVNSSRSKLQRQSSENASSKRFAKDVVRKYLKLIKPLYVRVSNRYGDNLKFSDKVPTANPSSSPALAPLRFPNKQPDERPGSRVAPLRVVCKHLGKSRSTSSAAGITPSPASKRDDSLLEQHDGIQSAILHCKRSYNSSREFPEHSRIASDPFKEIYVNGRISTEEEKKSNI